VQVYDLEADPFETTNIYAEHLGLVQDLRELCLSCIQDGRSTPGQPQPNDPNGEWQQLKALLELEVAPPA
jgi:hypothetical protein